MATNRKRTGAKKHTHKYHKIDGLWFCALPDCTHFMPRNMPQEAMLGKRSICWNCNGEMILDEDLLKEDKPNCAICSPNVAAIGEFLSQKGL